MKRAWEKLRAAWPAILVVLAALFAAGLSEAQTAVDRTTPKRTIVGFLEATDRHDDARAAKYLDLRGLARAKRADEGPILARQLRGVLDWKLPLDTAKISDAKEGDPADGAGVDVVGVVELEGESIPISVAKVDLDEGGTAWLFSRVTVGRIPGLDPKARSRNVTAYLPGWAVKPELRGVALWQWIGLVLVGILAHAISLLLGKLIGVFARKVLFAEAEDAEGSVRSLRAPVRLVLFVATADLLVDELYLVSRAQQLVDYVLTTIFVWGLAWLSIRSLSIGADALSHRLADDTAGELRSRGVRTQLVIMRKIVSLLIAVVALAIVLLQFPIVRTVGFSLLASAGLAGVVLGVAAQKSLGGIIAGIQLSLTQPLRIGDVIWVEQEWGTVEELTLTYVVVRIWDQRRLVVPIARFLEQPFQNWTKTSSHIDGTVLLLADYAVPVELLRVELRRICESTALWDGRTCVLQVTDIGEKAMQIRALVSAADAFRAWDLRCEVRERMMAFVTALEGGKYLPGLRAFPSEPRPELAPTAGAPAATAPSAATPLAPPPPATTPPAAAPPAAPVAT